MQSLKAPDFPILKNFRSELIKNIDNISELIKSCICQLSDLSNEKNKVCWMMNILAYFSASNRWKVRCSRNLRSGVRRAELAKRRNNFEEDFNGNTSHDTLIIINNVNEMLEKI
jgi:hypothetical protein